MTWKQHGGQETIESLTEEPSDTLIDFLDSSCIYHEEEDIVFAHACVPEDKGNLGKGVSYAYYWDRSLVKSMCENPRVLDTYKKIFVGHTPTTYLEDTDKSIKKGNLIMLDTGAGTTGRVTLMDIESEEYVQSELCMKLYPKEKGRNRHPYKII